MLPRLEPKLSCKRFVLSWQERNHNHQWRVQAFRNRSVVQVLHSHNRSKQFRNQQ